MGWLQVKYLLSFEWHKARFYSPALFALYVDELLVELRSLGIGCKVAGVFMGAVGFCDDLLLLAPTRYRMQVMLDTCQRFASKFNLMFSTDPNPEKSKTKCIQVFTWVMCSMRLA